MKTTVTFETAKALQDAGFPQPEPAPGQFWYIENDLYCCFWDDTNTRYILFAPGMSIDFETVKGLIFAPQAHDILEQIPEYCIFKDGSSCKGFVCYKLRTFRYGRECYDNPHEAAAQSYLQLHKPA